MIYEAPKAGSLNRRNGPKADTLYRRRKRATEETKQPMENMPRSKERTEGKRNREGYQRGTDKRGPEQGHCEKHRYGKR